MGTGADSAALWLRAPRLWLAGLTIAAFANATPNGFVWLDHWQVESGGLIVRSWPEFWSALQQPLGAMPGWEGSAPYARPCVVLLLSLIHAVAGTQPVAYHLTLELVHLANVLLVYNVLSALRIDSAVAFLTAALFAVHPLQTAAVSWVSGIADPLFTVFTLLALRLQLAASDDTRGALGRRGAAAVRVFRLRAGCEGNRCRSSAAARRRVRGAPGAVASQAERLRAVLRAVAPFCIVLVGAAFYRLQVLQGAAFGRPVDAFPLSVRLSTLPRLLLSYLTLPLRLNSLTVCDDYALSIDWDASTALALVVVAALCIGLLRFWRRSPTATFGVIWMVLGLLPVLNVVPILHYRADRFFYFPLIGWSLTFVVLIRGALFMLQRTNIFSAEHLRRGTTLATAVALLLLVGLTIRRNAAFADDRTLFESTLQVSPLCREAHTALGDAYLRAGRYADAATRVRAGTHGAAGPCELRRHAKGAHQSRHGGDRAWSVRCRRGRVHRSAPPAAAAAASALRLGIANLGLGQVATAANWLEQAYTLAPDDPDVVLNLALELRPPRPAGGGLATLSTLPRAVLRRGGRVSSRSNASVRWRRRRERHPRRGSPLERCDEQQSAA